MIREYEEIHPGLANRIFIAFESQLAHRQKLETSVTRGNRFSQVLGQVLGFLLALAILGMGGYLISIGKSVEGLITLGIDVTGLVSIFVLGRKRQEGERTQKREELEGNR